MKSHPLHNRLSRNMGYGAPKSNFNGIDKKKLLAELHLKTFLKTFHKYITDPYMESDRCIDWLNVTIKRVTVTEV